MNAGKPNFPLLTEISDYQNSIIDEEKKLKQIEIDLVGKNGKEILLVGECKFKNTPFDKVEFENLMDKIKYLPVNNPQIFIFSLSGFSDYVKQNADRCALVSIEDMYR